MHSQSPTKRSYCQVTDEREVISVPSAEKGPLRKRDAKATEKLEPKTKVAEDGQYSNFPEIPSKTITNLENKGINYLFPIQQKCFYPIFERHDLLARDLTGSGKTLAFALPTVEYLRKEGLLGSRKI